MRTGLYRRTSDAVNGRTPAPPISGSTRGSLCGLEPAGRLGRHAADDPQWRIYVPAGSCTGVPGPATAFDPTLGRSRTLAIAWEKCVSGLRKRWT